jgi:hypothetical protein
MITVTQYMVIFSAQHDVDKIFLHTDTSARRNCLRSCGEGKKALGDDKVTAEIDFIDRVDLLQSSHTTHNRRFY